MCCTCIYRGSKAMKAMSVVEEHRVPHLLGLDIPNFLPDWRFLQPGGRLIWATILFVVVTGAALAVIRRPKRSAEPPTWAAAITGALGVWVWLTLAYAVIPHEWLTFANSYLNFGSDTFALRQNSIVPFDVSRAAVKDAIAAGLYVVFLGLNVKLFAEWQKRPVAEPAEAPPDEEPMSPITGPFARLRRRRARTSAYGRPVTTAE